MTIEIPEHLFNQAKEFAKATEITLKQLVTEALEARLDRQTKHSAPSSSSSMIGFGQLSAFSAETRRIETAIEEEFERIEFIDLSQSEPQMRYLPRQIRRTRISF